MNSLIPRICQSIGLFKGKQWHAKTAQMVRLVNSAHRKSAVYLSTYILHIQPASRCHVSLQVILNSLSQFSAQPRKCVLGKSIFSPRSNEHMRANDVPMQCRAKCIEVHSHSHGKIRHAIVVSLCGFTFAVPTAGFPQFRHAYHHQNLSSLSACGAVQQSALHGFVQNCEASEMINYDQLIMRLQGILFSTNQ